jgi:hypothetical protein
MLLEIREWANNRYAHGSTCFSKVAKKHKTQRSNYQKASPEFTYSTGNPGRYLRASSHFKQP